MKTKGGFEIINFEELKTPINRGMLEPHIYSGLVKDVPSYNKTIDIVITWDKFGRCSNFERSDCFIEIDNDKPFTLADFKDKSFFPSGKL